MPPRGGVVVKQKKLEERRARLEEDARRSDGGSLTDTDLTRWVPPTISWGYQQLLSVAVTRFKEFITLVGPENPKVLIKDGDKYFGPGQQHLSLEIIKLFVLYLARTSSGSITEKLSVASVQHYVRHTLSAAFRLSNGQKQLPPEDMRQVYAYINHLVVKGELSNKLRTKPIATKNDLDIVITIIFSDVFARKLQGVRGILILALYMNLYVDVCARGSDLAWGGPAIAAQPNHCLCWDHIEFYALVSNDGDRVISANVTLHFQKGQRLSDTNKTVTLRLLPITMAMHDSLRLLTTLALIDGIFGPRITWTDLLAINSEAGTAQKILQLDKFIGVPVFRSAEGVPSRSHYLGAQIAKLGRIAGFKHSLTPYSLRRSYANVLHANASAEDRRFLMGHKTNSETYSHYHSAISTVQIQEIFRDVRVKHAPEMHGLSRDRIADIPQRISQAGWEKVQQDPVIVRGVQETSRLSADLQKRYGSLSAAARACDPATQDLMEAMTTLNNRRRLLMRTIYRQEYKQCFTTGSGRRPQPAESMSDDDSTLGDAHEWIADIARDQEAAGLLDDLELMEAPDPALRPDQPRTERHGHYYGHEQQSEAYGQPEYSQHQQLYVTPSADGSIYGPPQVSEFQYEQQQDQYGAYDASNYQGRVEYNGGGQGQALEGTVACSSAGSLVVLTAVGAVIPDGPCHQGQDQERDYGGQYSPQQKVPLHVGLDPVTAAGNDNILSDDDIRIGVSCKLSEGSELIRRHQVNNGRVNPNNASMSRFREAVSTGSHTDAALSKIMVEVFSAAHPSGKFIPGEEPLLGTMTCRFTGKDLSTVHRAAEAAHAAHANGLKQAAKETFERHLLPLDTQCSYHIQNRGLNTPKVCGEKNFKSIPHQMRHIHYHLTAYKKFHANNIIPHDKWHCFFNGCAILPTTETKHTLMLSRSNFSVDYDYFRHVYEEHRLSAQVGDPVIWCPFCEKFLEWTYTKHDHDHHFTGHWDETWNIVREHGYCGQYDLGRRTVPAFCPFCLHDENLSSVVRITAVTNLSISDHHALGLHIGAHIEAFNPLSTVRCPCFPTTCTYEPEMPPNEMWDHLVTIHGITKPNQSRAEYRKKVRVLHEQSVNIQGQSERAHKKKKE